MASLVVGAAVSGSSGRTPAVGALRQLAILTGSAAVTFGIGHVFGTTVA